MPLPLMQGALATARKVLVKDIQKSGAFLRFGLDLKSSREGEKELGLDPRKWCALNLETHLGLLVCLGMVRRSGKVM